MAKSAQATKHLVESKFIELSDTINDMLHEGKHKYLLVNVLAGRARELNRGEPVLIEPKDQSTYSEMVLQELAADKLKITRKQKSKVLVSLIKNE
ncbi:MAG: DNA-directed RNA polymerase subunit omega [Candidatus Sumerlaeia bacterium]